jgi:hypothetical protein
MNNPWDQIDNPLVEVNITARRIDHSHPLDLFWARDYLGHYLFLYDFPKEYLVPNNSLPDIKGIQIYSVISGDNSSINRIIISLKEQSNWELFLSLCQDLIQTTRLAQDTSSAIQILLRRLKRWQEFLKRDRPDILSEEEIKGLLGELLFIRRYLVPVFGGTQSIIFWQGPEGYPQDFSIENYAIEIKCHSSNSSPVIRISSADQLCPSLSTLYLMVFTLGKTSSDNPQAINLPILVKDFKNILEMTSPNSMERFTDLLNMIGYVDSDRYLEYSYLVTDSKMYDVRQGFPRICPNDISSDIVHLSYSINLSAYQSFEGHPNWMEIE